MAAILPPETPTAWELADRTSLQAFRAGRYLLIVAEGDLPTPGYDLDIQQSPIRIFPQHYNLVRRERPGIWPDVVVPYTEASDDAADRGRPLTVLHPDSAGSKAIRDLAARIAVTAPSGR